MRDQPNENLSKWQPTGRHDRKTPAAHPTNESELLTKVIDQTGQRGIKLVVAQLRQNILKHEIKLIGSTTCPQKSIIGVNDYPDTRDNSPIPAGRIPSTVQADI